MKKTLKTQQFFIYLHKQKTTSNDMSLRTPTELKEYLQAFKEKKLKDEENKKKKLKEERLQLQKQKNAHRRLQKLIAEEHQAKAEKDALRAFKCSLLSFRIYQTNLIERGFVEDELYTTREELQDAEDRGEGKLNWATFDDLVKKTKESLEHLHRHPKHKTENKRHNQQ